MATRTIYQRTDCRWGWRLTADNGHIIATDGSQGYENEADARRMADRIISGTYRDAHKRRQIRRECS